MEMADQQPEARLKGKVVIVTGGVQGIGRGIVDVFDELGATVVVLDIQDEIGATMMPSGEGVIIYMHCDMSSESEIKTAIEGIASRCGTIDCLVNNVGILPKSCKIDDYTLEDFQTVIQMDVYSTFLASKYALPHLRESKGSIVNISSSGSATGFKNGCTYIAAKGAINGLTVALATDEAEHGVRVNSLAPGPIDTPSLQSVTGEEGIEQINACTGLGRVGTPREIGLACAFLAFDATYMTGQHLLATGGYELGFGIKDSKLPL